MKYKQFLTGTNSSLKSDLNQTKII